MAIGTQAKAYPSSQTAQLGSVNTSTTTTTVKEESGHILRSVIYLGNENITITRTGTTNVYGGLKLYTLGEGIHNILGVSASLTVTRGETTNMSATAPLVVSLGTVTAANDATLTSTEANLIASTSCTLVAGTKAITATLATAAIFDGSSTATPVFLNVAGDNTGSQCVATGNSSVNVSGTIVITYVALGDY